MKKILYPFINYFINKIKTIYFRYINYRSISNSRNVKNNYFVLHIPRCGGTYFKNLLIENFSNKIHYDEYPYNKNKFQFYIQHKSTIKDSKFEINLIQNLKKIALLRDPVDRTLSTFYYYKNHNRVYKNESYKKYLNLTFDDFLVSKHNKTNLINKFFLDKFNDDTFQVHEEDYQIALRESKKYKIVLYDKIFKFFQDEFNIKQSHLNNKYMNKSIKDEDYDNIKKKYQEKIKENNYYDVKLFERIMNDF